MLGLLAYSVAMTTLGALIIIKGVGFGNLIKIFRVKKRMKKGKGLALIFQKSGFPVYKEIDMKGDTILPFGEEGGKYVFKNHCVFYNEFGAPTIMYKEDDGDPIDYRSGLQTNTNPKTLENLIANAVKAESKYSGDIFSMIKRHWMKIAAFYLGPLIVLAFITLQQQDVIADLSAKAGKQVVLNASSIGK